MSRFAASPNVFSRLTRASLIAFYAAIALLGSGGLHAIAPHGESNCCAHEHGKTVHAHHGCTHDHSHAHPATESGPKPDSSPGPCRDKSCAICEFAATPAMPIAVVELPPHVETAELIVAAVALNAPLAPDSTFWIRGPPAVI